MREWFKISGREIELHGYGEKPMAFSYSEEERLNSGFHSDYIDRYIRRWEVRDVTNEHWYRTLLHSRERPSQEVIETAVACDTGRYTFPVIAVLVVLVLILWIAL